MNSSLASGDVSAGAEGEETAACDFLVPRAFAAGAVEAEPLPCAGASATDALPGPRRRNSLMTSWPVETDSSSLVIVPVPVSSAVVAPSGAGSAAGTLSRTRNAASCCCAQKTRRKHCLVATSCQNSQPS